MNNKRFEIGASEQPLDIIKETCGFAGIFKQIGVIGDSLASGEFESHDENGNIVYTCLLYTSPSPRDMRRSRMPSSA